MRVKARPENRRALQAGDGLLELVLHESTEALQLSPTDTIAVLDGKTFNEEAIRGTDSVRVIP